MKKKKLSIIIPVYNVEDYISDSINSIILNERNLDNWLEIILVDDGSTDKSGSICDQYALRYSFIKVIHQKNQGQSVARNRALDIADGEWLTFVDSDDLVRKDYLSVVLSNIQNNKSSDIIIFKYKTFSNDEDITDIQKDYSPNNLSTLSKSQAMYYLTTNEIGNYMWNKVFKRNLFNKVRFPVGRRYEDIAVLYKYFQLANKICLYDDILYFYRQRTNSTIHIKTPLEKVDLLRDSIRARKEQLDFLKNYEYARAYKNAKHYYMTDEVMYIVWTNKYEFPKDKMYSNAQKFVSSYTPKINEGKKFYLFIKLYNVFPKLIEKYIKVAKRL